jgi:hypothetical protein
MSAYRHSREDDATSAYPYVILYDDGTRSDTLLIHQLARILVVMVESGDGDLLSQIHMIADGYWTDDGVANAYTGIVADNQITHSIVDARIALYDRVTAEAEGMEGRKIFAYRPIYYRALTFLYITTHEETYPPAGARLHGMHDEAQHTSFQSAAFYSFFYCRLFHNL